MTVTVANVDVDTDTFLTWTQKTSQLADAMTNYTVTVGGASYATTGNAHINGALQANAIYISTVRGGTIAAGDNINFNSNAVFNSNVYMSNTGVYAVFNTPSYIRMGGANTTNRFISIDSATGAGEYQQVISVGTTGSNVASGTATLVGEFNTNSVYTNILSGGNSSVTGTLSVTSNTSFTNKVYFANGTSAYMGGANTTHRILAGNSSTNAVTYSQIVSTDVADGTYNITANNSLYLGGIIASSYQLNSTLAANVAKLAANSATYLGGNTVGDIYTYVDSSASTSYSNSIAYSSNASNLSTGTIPAGRLASVGNFQITSLGVGTAASGTTGEIRATNNITAYYSSDISLKENIEQIVNPVWKVQNIRGVNFDWKDEIVQARGGEDGYFVRKHDIGVIAQEVNEILPEAVAVRDDGILAVNYEKIIPLLIEAIKELKAEIDIIKSK